MKLSRTASVTASLLLVGGLALTGCSSPGATGDGNSSASSSNASDSQGALTKDNFADRMSKAQLKAGSVHITMDMGEAMEGTIEADMVVNEDPQKVQMQMQMNAGGMDADIRLVDGKMFMNMGELSQGKFFDLSTMPGGAGDITAMLDQMNPGAQVAGFGDALTDFKADPKGPKIDGVETTQLTLTLDTKKMFEAQPQEGVNTEDIVAALGDTIVYDMFVGPDDLPRRIVMPNVGGAGTLSQEFTAWGEPVSVTAPAADEIADASTLQG